MFVLLILFKYYRYMKKRFREQVNSHVHITQEIMHCRYSWSPLGPLFDSFPFISPQRYLLSWMWYFYSHDLKTVVEQGCQLIIRLIPSKLEFISIDQNCPQMQTFFYIRKLSSPWKNVENLPKKYLCHLLLHIWSQYIRA